MPAPHFTPWQSTPRPCWHCTAFAGLTAGGSAARCTRPGTARVRSMPGTGCASFEREVGADDEPDHVPADLWTVAPHGGPWKAQEVPSKVVPVRWAP